METVIKNVEKFEIEKTLNIFVVKTSEGPSVAYPTLAKAKQSKKLLEIFGVETTIEKVRKKVTV